MIERAKFQNFKALRDVEITFDSRLTVLVGPNGSGKSSILEGIQFLAKGFELGPPSQTGFTVPGMVLTSYGWQGPPPAFFDERTLLGACFEVATRAHNGNELICRFRCSVSGKQISEPIFEATSNGGTLSTDLPQFNQIRSTTLLRLDPAQLRRPSLPQSLPPQSYPDGTGLATSLAYLQKKYPEQFQSVIDSLQRVIPNVVRIRLDLQRTNNGQFPDVLIFDFKGAVGVTPASTSDGTMFVLGLLSVILGPEPPKLLLLDDVDHRLHPKAQMDLVDLLHRLLDQFPDLQIIATSHSPYILDRLKPNEVRVMALRDDGSAACARLEDHPKYPMWKDSMKPGEFWSNAGEDWVKKLTPQAATS